MLDFLSTITSGSDKLDDRLVIWGWKTGVLLVNMICAPSHKALSENPLDLLRPVDYPAGLSWELVRSRAILSQRPVEILLNVHRLCPFPQSRQQQVPPAIIRNYVLKDVRPLRSSQKSAPMAVRPGALLRGHVAARFQHSDRGDVPFAEEEDSPGTARPH